MFWDKYDVDSQWRRHLPVVYGPDYTDDHGQSEYNDDLYGNGNG